MIYEFKCEKCGERSDHHFSVVEKPSSFETECKVCGEVTNHVSVISAPNIVSGVNFSSKVPGDFKNRLDQIKKHYPKMKSSI